MINGLMDSDDLKRDSERLLADIEDATPVMLAIAGTLLDVTEQDFAEQGRPKWLGIKPRKGRADGRVLQDSGWLAANITPAHDPDFTVSPAYAGIDRLRKSLMPADA